MSKINVWKGFLAIGMVLAMNVSCDTITEELPPCSNYVRFTYTRNMKFADAFPVEVRSVDLFVFDANDLFVTRLSRVSPFVAGGKMELSLPPGRYHLVAWAGLNEKSYMFQPELVKGVSTPKDLTVKMKREQAGNENMHSWMNQELEPLWHSEADVELTAGKESTTVMDLTKDTNKLRLILQADVDTPLKSEDMDFSVTAANGYLNFDNSLLSDEPIVYRPYYISDEVVVSENGEPSLNVVVAELNTMRLMEDGKVRLLVKRNDGKKIVDVDLIQYLLLTKMEGHQLPVQEYLDRQDEYAVVFLLNGDYMVVQIKINEWVIRPQDGNL